MTVAVATTTTILTNTLSDFGSAFIERYVKPITVGERLSGEAIRVVNVRRVFYDTGNFVFPKGLSEEQLKRLNQSEEGLSEALIREAGGIEVGSATWEISLQGRRTQPVEIIDIRRQLEGRCSQPTGGTLVTNFSASQTEKIPIFLGIDDPRPVAMQRQYKEDGSYVDTPYFRKYKITLDKGKTTTLVITAETNRASCRWKLLIDYLDDDKERQLVVTSPDEQPFAITGTLPPNRYESIILGCDHAHSYKRISPHTYAHLGGDTNCT